jgi:hypothetical protein
MAETIREAYPRSKGKIRCNACGIAIPKGVRYRRATIVDGRDIWDWHECVGCFDASFWVVNWTYSPDLIDSDTYSEWADDTANETDAEGDSARAYLGRARAAREEVRSDGD